MINKYAGTCYYCDGPVKKGAGIIFKKPGKNYWFVRHITCDGEKGVNVVTFSSGDTVTQNKKGRCIDAPCCGCCTC